MHRLIIAFICTLSLPNTSFSQDADVDAARITVRMTPGITSSRQLGSPALVAARRALGAGEFVPFSSIRELADRGDGFAALRFAQALENLDTEVALADIAHYYGVAAATGRGGALNGLIRVLDQIDSDDLSDERSAILKNIVITYTLAGNSRALDAVLRYNLRQEPFGALDEELHNVLDEKLSDVVEGENDDGTARLALQLAVSIMRNPASTTEDLNRAEGYVEIAVAAPALQTQLMAENVSTLLEAELQGRAELSEASLELPASAEGDVTTPVFGPANIEEESQ